MIWDRIVVASCGCLRLVTRSATEINGCSRTLRSGENEPDIVGQEGLQIDMRLL